MAYQKAHTLCWKCSNYNKCSWSKGVPVEGWTAERVKITNSYGESVRSYIVSACPQFKSDKIVYTTCSEIAEIIGETRERTSHLLNRARKLIDEELLKKGYKLRCYEGDSGWYLEKLQNDKDLIC